MSSDRNKAKQEVISIQKIDIKLDELVYRPLESIYSYIMEYVLTSAINTCIYVLISFISKYFVLYCSCIDPSKEEIQGL